MEGDPSLDAEVADEDDSDEGKEDGLEYLDELEDKASEYVDLDQLNGEIKQAHKWRMSAVNLIMGISKSI